MPRQPARESTHDWNRREESRIAAASSQNKIRPVPDRLLEWLHAHHAYDATAAIDDVVADWRRRVQRHDAAMLEQVLEVGLVLFRIDHGSAQLQFVFRDDFTHDLQDPVNVHISACCACRAHDYRDVRLSSCSQHQRQVVLYSLSWKGGNPHPQGKGACIGRPCVAGDEVSRLRQRLVQGNITDSSTHTSYRRYESDLATIWHRTFPITYT